MTKTKLVRPIVIDSNEINKVGDICLFPYRLNIAGKDDIGYPKKELILISLDEDEEIKVGDAFYNPSTDYIRVAISDLGLVKHDVCEKVIARQHQLSPSYIATFIEQYNNNDVKDIEIEMFNKCEKPKLTNGYITIVDKLIIEFSTEMNGEYLIITAGKYNDEKLILDKPKAALLFAELWKFLEIGTIVKNYTEEEVLEMVKLAIKDFNEAVVDRHLGNTDTIKFNTTKWFNDNKKEVI